MKRQTIPEILQELNDMIGRGEPINRFYGINALKEVLSYALLPELKFILPEGLPPFKQDPGAIGLTPSTLANESKRLYIFCRKDLTPLKRETLFINMLESLHKDEVDVLILIKEQNIISRFPNLESKNVIPFLKSVR